MSILDVIERARKEPPYLPPNTSFPDNFYTCEVLDPIPWDRRAIEKTFGFELPPEIVELWNACGGMRLYCDSLWCPGGLVVCSPTDTDVLKENKRYHKNWPQSLLPGDLVFAKFLDNLEQPLLRCDLKAEDYGSVIIVAEMDDQRPDWDKAASSLEEFLIKFMDARGEKYWEYHYQKRLAEKAALEAQRNK